MKAIISLILTLLLPLSISAQPCQTAIVKNIAVQDFQATHSGAIMNVTMTFILDSLKIRSDQQLMLTPVLYNETDTIPLARLFVNGRRQQIQYERGMDSRIKSGDFVIQRKNNTQQSVTYHAITPYRQWMENYTAAIFEDDCGCGKLVDQSATDILVVKPPYQPQLAFLTPPVEKKLFQIEKKARITFIVDKTYLDPTYMQNPSELDSIYKTIQLVRNDPNITITNINIHGTASPESPYAHNTELASGRANTIKEYVSKMVQLPASVFTSSYTPENWDELIQYIKNSGITLKHKDEILALCQDESIEPDAREAKIKKHYPEEYQYMYKNWYPDLRRTTYRVQYLVREFSIDEAKQIIKTKPQQLSLNELYRVAETYEPGSNEFNEVMEIAVRLHPEDTFANLNAALTRLNAGDIEGAEKYLPKAGKSPEAENARGTIAYKKGDIKAARTHYKNAAKQGLKQAQENLEKIDE